MMEQISPCKPDDNNNNRLDIVEGISDTRYYHLHCLYVMLHSSDASIRPRQQ